MPELPARIARASMNAIDGREDRDSIGSAIWPFLINFKPPPVVCSSGSVLVEMRLKRI
jgi:hypothetical protein